VAVPDAHVHDDLAGEMMEDPIFHLNPDLADVDQVRTANNFVLCNGDSVTTLPDGREVYVPGGFTWPDIPGELWWEEEVQTIALKGAPMTLVNNTAAITKVLTEWNLSHGWPRVPGEGSSSSGDLPTGDYSSGPGSSTRAAAARPRATAPRWRPNPAAHATRRAARPACCCSACSGCGARDRRR
jgi:hypothetical protein